MGTIRRSEPPELKASEVLAVQLRCPWLGTGGPAAAPAPPEFPGEIQLGRACQRLRMCEAARMTVGSWRSGWEQGWGLKCSSTEGLHLWKLGLAHSARTLAHRGREDILEAEERSFWGVGICLNTGEQRDKLGHTKDVGKGGTAQIQGPALLWRGPQCSFPTCDFQDSISLLLEAVRTKNEELAQTWKKSEQWATIEQLCSKRGEFPGAGCPAGRGVPWLSWLGSCSQAATEATAGSWGGGSSLFRGSWNICLGWKGS